MNSEEGIGKKSPGRAWGIPPVLPEAKPPPFDKGGFGLCVYLLRSNDTGRVREKRIVESYRAKLSAATGRRYRALEGQ